MTWSIRSLVFVALSCLAIIAPQAVQAGEKTAYPIVIKHAFGTTTIEKKPDRIVTVAWANHEVPLALGVVPVGFARANFGDDDNDGLLPWVAAKLKELGADTPVLFDEGDGIDFEAVAETQPDVILASYSGLSQSDYETLSQIAPVVAYPEAPWSTDWRDMIRLNSAGMGMAEEGEALIAKIEGEIAETVSQYPHLKGKSAMFVTHLDTTDLSTVNFYTTNDTRVRFFKDLGLNSPKSVVDASRPGQFSGSISAERVDMFDDVDIVVTYGSQELLDAMKGNPLSISWVLKDYVALLAGAADKAK